MKIVQSYAKIIEPAELSKALKKIEWCGRISHRSEAEQKADSAEKFLKFVVLTHGDWSIVEHVSASVDFLVDRGITHEIVRHRIAAYTQESTRFVNYAKKMPPSFIYPKTDVVCRACSEGYEPVAVPNAAPNDAWVHFDVDGLDINCDYSPLWLHAIATSEEVYRLLIQDFKWRPQEARSVFPNGLSSRLIMTCNLRNWRHFFLMRTTKEAHPQMRLVTIPLLKQFKQYVPVLFDDIEPDMQQSDSIARGR